MAFDQTSVFVDTSAFKALIDEKDDFHSKAVQIWNKLVAKGTILVTSNFTIDETLTLVRIRCGLAKAKDLRDKFIKSVNSLKIVRVTAGDEADAWKWFEKDWAGLSFTDCVSFVIMKRLDINQAATFDNHFERAGFKMVE